VNTLDLAITFGGDGALLHAVHRLGINHPPLVGVNVGSLGFLAEISPEYLEESLQLICLGNYSLTEQIMLELKDEKGPAKFAVNEIAFHRECVHNLIDLNVMVDGKLFNTFSSDGLIVATPAGSTAYSLAAGGPIVAPNLNAIIITPICPHTISNRPVVLSPTSLIEVTLSRGAEAIGIAVDGINGEKLYLNQTRSITISPHRFKLISLPYYNYFQALREKLGWSGSLKKRSH
jgi:NAD+ kinase